MAAVTKNLIADKGATFSIAVLYRDVLGNLVDLTTGYVATLTLFPPGDATPLFVQVGVVTADGWIKVVVTDETTTTWPEGKSAYRLSLARPDGGLDWLLIGALMVRSGLDV